MERDKINVIIPTFKPGDYIFECISSIENQSLQKNRYYLTIVLNGEKEPYYYKIKDYLSNISCDAEIIYVEERGVSNARNIAIEKTNGDYIVFVDDDDVISSSYLEDFFRKRNENGIVVSNCLDFYDNINNSHDSFMSDAYRSLNDISRVHYSIRSIFSTCWGKLIPVKIINKSRFNKKVAIGEDCCFMLSILPHIEYLYKSEPEGIYFIRNRVESASRKRKSMLFLARNKYYQIKDYLNNILYFTRKNKLIYLNRLFSAILYWK